MFIRKLILFSFLITVTFYSLANRIKLSDEAEISVMTLGPYQGELYSVFGHTAIHLSDPAKEVEWVYNYGIFDFDQENFFVNFAKGQMLYKLGLSDYRRFVSAYIKQDRYVVEQVLNLTQEEKQHLADLLAVNYKPENRDYLYNYVYDNCATKIPELLERQFQEKLLYDQNYVQKGKTIRDLMDDYLTYQPWGDWIIDIGLGQQIDKHASPQEYMFLPEYVMKALSDAQVIQGQDTVQLVKKTRQVFTPSPQAYSNGLFTPMNTFVFLFFIIGFITNRDFKKRKRTKWVDPICFTLAGLLGWWLVFLWLGTEHLSKYNWNLLWAIPMHIPFAYMLGIRRFQPFLRKYFLVVAILYSAVLVFWSALPQPLHQALIPYILLLILRSITIHYSLGEKLGKPKKG